jgi:hypothetical protein
VTGAGKFYGQWAEVRTVGLSEIGRIVGARHCWRGSYGPLFGLYWDVEFKRKFLWIFALKRVETYHTKNVYFLPILEQLAMEGK